MAFKEIVNSVFQKENCGTRYLLALSGGIDSTVLFHLMIDFRIDFEVAHANFGLRGEDSIADELFVKQICEANDVPCNVQHFDTLNYIQQNNESIQSGARKLRYEWFEDVLKKHKLDKIVTAHTLNDSAETFFINLFRGTGIHGLQGIQTKSRLLRPFLGITKEEITTFAKKNNIIWREDTSNATDNYVRNRIRHHIVPVIEEIEPNFHQQFNKTIELLKGDVQIIDDYVRELRPKLFKHEKNYIFVYIEDLIKLKNDNLLYYLFKPYGFQYPKEILKLMHASESAEIQSTHYRLIKDRTRLILTEKLSLNLKKYTLRDLDEIIAPIHLKFNLFTKRPNTKNDLLDFDKIKFPLSLRIRQTGDVFYPSGMEGKSKNLSKFYKDLKFSKIEKEQTWLLCDADDHIIWVVDYRYDERFIATNKTKTWLQIEKLG